MTTKKSVLPECRTFIIEGHLKSESPLATCSKDLKDRSDLAGKNRPIPVPKTETENGTRLYFPGTGIRGKLRRLGRDIVRNAVAQATGNPTPFSLDEHYFNTLGGIKGEDSQDRSTVALVAEYREKNLLLSLFGAGDAGVLGFVDGHLGVGNAIAQEASEPVIFSGVRSDDLYRDKSQVQFLSESDIKSLIARAQGGKTRSVLQAEIAGVEKDLKKAMRNGTAEQQTELSSRLEALNSQKAQVKTDSGTSDVSVGMPLAGWEAIPQGEILNQRMILTKSNETELGFVLHILNHFAMFPIIGAHYAVGNGLVSGEWQISEPTLQGRRTLGSVSFKAFDPLVLLEVGKDGGLHRAMDAFDAYLKSSKWDFSIPTAA